MNYQKLLDPHPQIVNSFVHFFGRRTSQFLLATQAPPSASWLVQTSWLVFISTHHHHFAIFLCCLG